MSRDNFKGPKLPKTILDQVGGADSTRRREVPRKDRRKAERQQKKATRSRPPPRVEKTGKAIRRQVVAESEDDDDDEDVEVRPLPKQRAPKKEETKAVKSILKKSSVALPPPPPPPLQAKKAPSPLLSSPSLNEEDAIAEESDESTDSFTVSRQAAKAGLSNEDEAIAALERKLGKRGGKKSKQSTEVGNDGSEGDGDGDLDWLLGGADSSSEEEQSRGVKRKRAAPADEKWLRDKRRKAGGVVVEEADDDLEEDMGEESEEADGVDDVENPFSEDDLSENGFDGIDDDDDDDDDDMSKRQPVKKARENPYIAPPTTASQDAAAAAVQATTKYIPPSLRAKLASSDSSDPTLQQLQRQLQGQLNRLSEANMLSILQSIEKIYTTNPRQHVTSSLVDLLITRVSDPARLEDAYVVLHAGFSAALYRVIGVAFGAQLLEKVVETVDNADSSPEEAFAAEAKGKSSSTTTKQRALNTMAFLSILYNLHVVGATIIFDYIRQLLIGNLSETNAEILLRVLHFSGQQLRADDPSSLKDIILLLQRQVAEAGGEDQVAPRTKFLIREINDLKNNRQKSTGGAPGGSSKTIVSEHLMTIKKTLGTLSSSRDNKAPEPLRPTLADIRSSAQKGKWWLPGASWHDPAKMDAATTSTTVSAATTADDAGYESETPGHVNLSALARAQGMNTSVRRSIFITIMSSADYRDAHLRLLKLHLKAKQMAEMARVLIHCVGAEGAYNPYYALVAKKLCGDGRVRKAMKFGLWDFVKTLEEGGESEDGKGVSGAMIGNLAKFFAALMAAGPEDGGSGLELDCLKKMDLGVYMQARVAVFAEALLTSLLLQLGGKGKKGRHERISTLFRTVGPELGTPLGKFLESVVGKGEMAAGEKERRVVVEGVRSALVGLEEGKREAPEGESVLGMESGEDDEVW